MNLYGLLDAIIGKVNRSVKVDTQELGETLQRQARNNIGAVGKEEICNPNLLDNWYFLNPINQRGQNEYNSSWPSIDRWNTACKIIINEEGLLASSETENWGIQQELSFELFQGENFTGSIFLTEVTGTVTLILQEAGGNWITPLYYDISAPGVHSISTIIPSGGQLNKFNFGLLIKSGSAQIKAIKFERGNTQTLAHQDSNNNWVLNEIPKYEEELLKCRQYDPYTGKYIGLRKFSQPHNILDNSYFLNPVNQRGQTSYTGSGYTIDRWRTNFSGDTIEQTSAGIKNTNTSTSNGWHFHQILDGCSKYVGKYLTCAAKINNFLNTRMRLVVSFRNSAGEEISTIRADTALGIIIVNGIVPTGTVGIKLGFYAYSGVASGDFVELEWVALYEGAYTADTLPEYQPKGYAAELAECQRYYYRMQSKQSPALYGLWTMNVADNAQIMIPIPQKFRTNPTVTISDNVVISYNTGSSASPSAAGTFFVSMTDNVIWLRWSQSNIPNTNSGLIAGISTSAYIEFNADL